MTLTNDEWNAIHEMKRMDDVCAFRAGLLDDHAICTAKLVGIVGADGFVAAQCDDGVERWVEWAREQNSFHEVETWHFRVRRDVDRAIYQCERDIWTARAEQAERIRSSEEFQERRRAERTYVVSNGRAVKIGRSSNVDQRLKSLQTSNDEELVLVATAQGGDLEREAHIELWPDHKRGEWFTVSDDVVDFVQAYMDFVPGGEDVLLELMNAVDRRVGGAA